MTRDNLLTIPDQQERLSMAYAYAVAAQAGYSTAVYVPDRNGIDLRIQAGGDMHPALEIQLKATINLRQADSETFHFRLPVRNYNFLRIRTQTPRLLVVLDLPPDAQEWLTVTDEALIMRRNAYWLNLCDWDETDNQDNITVAIPRANRFDVSSLQALIEQSRRGEI